MRKTLIALLVPAVLVGSLLGPARARKPKKKPPVTFEATGSIAVPNPADVMNAGLTRTEFETACAVPTATQGADGYVVELPPKVTAVTSRVYVTGTSPTGVGLLDMFFFDESCGSLGRILGSDDGDPLMPAGTKFVLVTNWLGDPTTFTLTATEVR